MQDGYVAFKKDTFSQFEKVPRHKGAWLAAILLQKWLFYRMVFSPSQPDLDSFQSFL